MSASCNASRREPRFSKLVHGFHRPLGSGRALWNEIAGRTGFDVSHIECDQLFATLHRIVVEEEGLAADKSPKIPEAEAASIPAPDGETPILILRGQSHG